MNALYDITKRVTCKYSNQIKKACLPLQESFQLSDVWYFKTLNSGYGSYFSSHPEWSEFFASQDFFLNFPLIKHPTALESGVFLFNDLNDENFSKISSLAQEKFQIHHSLAILQRTPDGIEGFGVSANSSQGPHLTSLINELPLLTAYFKKFKETYPSLFSKMEENLIDFESLIGPSFLEGKKQSPFKKESIFKFLEIDQLTDRECEVLYLLSKGQSAPSIGKSLFLSKRTIEHYIEKLKLKLDCSSKQELIEKALFLGSYVRL